MQNTMFHSRVAQPEAELERARATEEDRAAGIPGLVSTSCDVPNAVPADLLSLQLTLPAPATVARFLTAVLLWLAAAHMVTQAIKAVTGHDYMLGLIPRFDLDQEVSVGTWYQTLALFLSAAVLAVIAFGKRYCQDRYAWHWTGLAVLFVGLSLDEAASLHEMTIRPLRLALGDSGYLHTPWVILGLTFSLLVFVAYWQFLWHLPSRTRRWFLFAGAIYIGGAIGMETINGNYAYHHGVNNFTLPMLICAEEVLEKAGIIVFLYALLTYLGKQFPMINVRIGRG